MSTNLFYAIRQETKVDEHIFEENAHEYLNAQPPETEEYFPLAIDMKSMMWDNIIENGQNVVNVLEIMYSLDKVVVDDSLF